MRSTRNVLILCFLILSAVVIGGLIANLTDGVPALRWLTYGDSLGFNYGNAGALIDLNIFKLNFGFEMRVSVLQIILICVALLVWRKVR